MHEESLHSLQDVIRRAAQSLRSARACDLAEAAEISARVILGLEEFLEGRVSPKPLPVFDENEPSVLFTQLVRTSGTEASIQCEHCGRVHFSGLADNLDELLALSEKDPDRYVGGDGEVTIEWGHLDDKQAVVDCPCGVLAHYEWFIWSHRRLILDYLTDRSSAALANLLGVQDSVRTAVVAVSALDQGEEEEGRES